MTHALLLTTSITLMTFKIADFKYKQLWKVAVCFLLTFVYALIEIYILKIQTDPMYFMPDGDIQADILRLDYGVYLSCYIALIVIYIIAAHMIGDRETVKMYAAKWKARHVKEKIP